jgi:GNAT superfamily N-acetyltransferase
MNAFTRPLQASDYRQWSQLWQGYLMFYETSLSEYQTELTWGRLIDPQFGIHALVAEFEGELVGFAHYSFTHSTWAKNQDVYLEDLFVKPSVRGQGLGKLLILGLDVIAKSEGSREVYWETHNNNQAARKLYDSVGQLSEFVKYSRPVDY